MFLRRAFGRLSTASTSKLTGKDGTSFFDEKRLFVGEEFDTREAAFLLCVHKRVSLYMYIMHLTLI